VADDTIFIANPPPSRPVLHEINVNLSNRAPAWLLLDADWVHSQLFRKSRRGLQRLCRQTAEVSAIKLAVAIGESHGVNMR
jgi:hypothetical protein